MVPVMVLRRSPFAGLLLKTAVMSGIRPIQAIKLKLKFGKARGISSPEIDASSISFLFIKFFPRKILDLYDELYKTNSHYIKAQENLY